MLDGSQPVQPDWASTLAHDLAWPHYHMPWWEAAGRRLRRNYQWIYAILLASWMVVLVAYPTPATSLSQVVKRAAIGPVSGVVVFMGIAIFYGALITLGVYSYWQSRHAHRLPAGHPDRMREEPHA
jgi:uncharacterized membrane protein